jgi:hypothetical protein
MSVRDSLDHEITFVFFASLAIVGALAFMTWASKAANIPGLAALTQHP